MTHFRRYAVYWTPDPGPFAAFGARWLGWDLAAGASVAQPRVAGLDMAEITAVPRRYGFHATLKPPFRLAAPAEAPPTALEAFASRQRAFEAPPLQLARIGRFLALTPSAPCPALAGLASACVRELDRFRAPPGAEELRRRRAAGLSARQEALLRRWGYPYVMEEFRFHLTLTGPLDEATLTAAEAALAPLVAPFRAAPTPIDSISLCGEAGDGRFRLIRRFPLSA